MAETGTPLPAIASAFAVTEAHVRRRLKLASLPEPILDALKAGQISAGHAQAFTVCADTARQLALLPDVVQRRMSEDTLRRVLTQEQVRADDRRAVFVGLDAYQEAGGTLTRDLFAAGDEAFLDNPALLDRLFQAALETAAEAKKAEGWRWIETLPDAYTPWNIGAGMARVYPLPDDLPPEAEEELRALNDRAEAGEELDDEELARLDELESSQTVSYQPEHRAVAGGWLYVDRDGDLCEALGFIRPEDREAAVEVGAIEPPRASPSFGPSGMSSTSSAAPTPAKSSYSFALVDDMRAIRLAAVQTALLDHPELVLDLLAFALQPESGCPRRTVDIRPKRQRIDPAEAKGFTRDPRLREGPTRYGDGGVPLADFLAFRAQGPEHRNTVLTETFARTLCYNAGPSGRGGAAALFEEIERESGANVRAVWRPTAANFFGRVSAAYLDDLLKNLLGLEPSNPGVKAFRGMRKADKAHAMERLFSDPEYQAVWGVTPETKARIDAWVPDCA
jgi:ParB family chromosome partitioning protein